MDYEKKTIEEKAKAYDEAIEKAKEYLYSPRTCFDIEQLYNIFPELKDSEDEQIRKWLIDTIKSVPNDSIEWDVIDKSDVLAWLEKQGEKKPVSITDEWIEDYWQHEKVNNPYSYDKGEEIQFDHQGFVRFCKKYCKSPAEWSEEDERLLSKLQTYVDIECFDRERNGDDLLAWLKSFKDRVQSQDKWKPSDEQINELCRVISGCSYDIEPLVEMAEQLKKLKEE